MSVEVRFVIPYEVVESYVIEALQLDSGVIIAGIENDALAECFVINTEMDEKDFESVESQAGIAEWDLEKEVSA